MILPDKLYTIIKWILCTVVPASIALISGLGLAYGWDNQAANYNNFTYGYIRRCTVWYFQCCIQEQQCTVGS